MNAAHRAAMARLYAPTASELAQALPGIASGIADSLALLSHGLTLGLLTKVQTQARGLEQYLAKLREAAVREGEA